MKDFYSVVDTSRHTHVISSHHIVNISEPVDSGIYKIELSTNTVISVDKAEGEKLILRIMPGLRT